MVRLYTIPVSNAANAGRGMVAYKRLPHRLVRLKIGFHPVLVRMAGFSGPTVPALEVDGRKVQGTLNISRALDELMPERPLFPADPDRRRAVEEAEAWGEGVFQHAPRRIFRRALVESHPLRLWLAREVIELPAPGVNAVVGIPITRALANASGSSRAGAEQALADLPALLDQIDALIANGTIGGDEPNAADFQILASISALGLVPRFSALAGRPCEQAAARLFPDYDGPTVPVEALPDWLRAGLVP